MERHPNFYKKEEDEEMEEIEDEDLPPIVTDLASRHIRGSVKSEIRGVNNYNSANNVSTSSYQRNTVNDSRRLNNSNYNYNSTPNKNVILDMVKSE